MRVAILFLAILTLSGWLTARAEDPPAPDAAQIRKWINGLANSKPQRRHSFPSDRLTDEERKLLEPVKESYSQLSKHFVASLPYLMKSLGDKRYSYPSEHPSSGVF